MKPRLSKQTREILWPLLFCLLSGRIAFALWCQFAIVFHFRDEYWHRPGALFGCVATLITILLLLIFAVVRIVILLRRRVPHGHCPHCGRQLAAGANRCASCNGAIRRASGEHERRTLHRGILRNGIVLAAWLCLAAWALSFQFDLYWESSRYRAGEGWAIDLHLGQMKVTESKTLMANGAPAPTVLLDDLLIAADRDHRDLNRHWHDDIQTSNWWIEWNTYNSSFYLPRGFDSRGQDSYPHLTELAKRYNLGQLAYGTIDRSAILPLWMPTLLFGIFSAIFLYRERMFPPGCCQTCGYDLDSVAGGACPECGTPKSDSTYGVPTRWRRKQATETTNE